MELEEPSDEGVSLVMEEDSDDQPIGRLKRKRVLDDSDSDEPIMKRASLIQIYRLQRESQLTWRIL